uniref:Uncharacterized LOC100178422 n=1 Tax=Ciona intestinalis TaxID=7719 RepID=H2XMZ0_CIOIN|nr:uncharacterized protein LOC100178422 [Ciona intestinalis]|eukprot:XP_002124619.1 uncharacterized protein LOC100178422 [Ciona intestinalis]
MTSSHFVYKQAKRKSCEGSHCAIAALIVVTIVSVVAIIVDGFVIAKPGIPALHYKKTKCITLRRRLVEHRTCKCGGLLNDSPYCLSKFACYGVEVEYTVGAARENRTGTIRTDEALLNSENRDCSFAVCKKNMRQNSIEVSDFITKYGYETKRFSCYYDPNKTENVIIKPRFELYVIVLSLLIPGIVFLTSVFFLAMLCHTARKYNKDNDLRIPAHRPYLNYGVELEDGSFTRERRLSQLLPGYAPPPNKSDGDVRRQNNNRPQSRF